MAAVQQHTPRSTESRGSKAFIDSMEEEVQRCSEHLQRRHSKRIYDRTLNGYSRMGIGNELNGGDEAGARRKRINTLPRSFTVSTPPMPSEPESHDLSYLHSRTSRVSSRYHRTLSGSMKAPIGANICDPLPTNHLDDSSGREQVPVSDQRGGSAPLGAAYSYQSGSSGSERGYSSRESSTTPIHSPVGHGPVGSQSRSRSVSPSLNISPPPIAPKPSRRPRERARAWSQKHKGTTRHLERNTNTLSPVERETELMVITALPEDSSSAKTIPVSDGPIDVTATPLEFPSAEVELVNFGAFGEIDSQTPSMKVPETTEPTSSSNHFPYEADVSHDNITHTNNTPNSSITPEDTADEVSTPATEVIAAAADSEAAVSDEQINLFEKLASSPGREEELVETDSLSLHSNSPDVKGANEMNLEVAELKDITVANDDIISLHGSSESGVDESSSESLTEATKSLPVEVTDQFENELSAPEIKSVLKKINHFKEDSSHKQSPTEVVQQNHKQSSQVKTRKTHNRTLSESKIHITVSSSVNMADIIQSAQSTILDQETGVTKQMDQKTLSTIKDLQAKLKEKEEELMRMVQQRDNDNCEKDEQIQKFTKDNRKIEREKWKFLKRARDATERALQLRTQLDTKEGNLRSVQNELDRTKDELFSVKSANTSLRALLSELRTPRPSVDVSVQVELGGTLKRNKSIELAFSQGGLSGDVQETGIERASEFRMSTSSLQWPERCNSERWERENSVDLSSLNGEGTVLSGGASISQPSVPWDIKANKKKSRLFGGKLRRSTGSRTESTASMDGLDISKSSILRGTSRTTPIPFPYQSVPPDMKEHWKVLDKARSIPFNKWTEAVVVAWLEAELGMAQYTAAVREKAPSGQTMLSLSETDMEKKLGISNPLHRKKLKLAIDDCKDPANCLYPHAGKIEHSWVAFEWAHDCGLAHLTEVLMANLVDGRLLNSLSKEDIRKYLKIVKKTDQLSFFSAVELLRMHEFNREAIQDHRRTANNPLYWTNRDICDWLKDIQLEEYASNVIGGGVHGALLFLERGRFTSDHLASIIQIPSSKAQLKRHLTGKMARLFTQDINQSIESLPSHLMLSTNFPNGFSSHGSQSPERRLMSSHSPLHKSTSSPPPSDCLHPSAKNSLTGGRSALDSLLQPTPPHPRQFTRSGSGPSPRQQRLSQVAAAERVRLSLRESARRSVSLIHEERANTTTPTTRSFTPTVLTSTATTV